MVSMMPSLAIFLVELPILIAKSIYSSGFPNPSVDTIKIVMEHYIF
jgi:hypothetical protein